MTLDQTHHPGRALSGPDRGRPRPGGRRRASARVLVGVGADMRYLAGYPAMPLERLTMLVIPAAGDWALVVPRLEATPPDRARRPPPACCRS